MKTSRNERGEERTRERDREGERVESAGDSFVRLAPLSFFAVGLGALLGMVWLYTTVLPVQFGACLWLSGFPVCINHLPSLPILPVGMWAPVSPNCTFTPLGNRRLRFNRAYPMSGENPFPELHLSSPSGLLRSC